MSTERENTPEQKPFHSIDWNGSKAEIYNPTAALDEAQRGEIKLYDRADFQTPIERVQVSIQKVGIDGETCTALTAKIRLDRTRDDYSTKQSGIYATKALLAHYYGQRDILSTRSAFVPYNNKDHDLNIEETVFPNVFKISHTSGTKVLVWVDSKENLITISNNLSLSGGKDKDKAKSIVVEPPPDGTIEIPEIFEGFFKAFMRTMDFTAGLPDYDPTRKKLNRTYPVGKERVATRSQNRPASVGKSALSGTSEDKNHEQSKETLPEELGLDIVNTRLSLDDIGGLESVKSMLRNIAISFQHPEIMEKWGAKRPQGVLMYGEPGTGKTMLAEALANEIEAEMWALQSSDIYDKWLGNSEAHIKDIFNRARAHKGKLVLFFDEFDSIVGISENPTSGGDNARNSVAGIFKQEMNNLAGENPNVLVVAATNNLDRIDPALVRSGRFDHKVYVPMPDQEARQQIIINIAVRSMLGQESDGFKILGDDLSTAELAVETDGMSGADITEIFRRLSLARAMQEARTGEPQQHLSHKKRLNKKLEIFAKTVK